MIAHIFPSGTTADNFFREQLKGSKRETIGAHRRMLIDFDEGVVQVFAIRDEQDLYMLRGLALKEAVIHDIQARFTQCEWFDALVDVLSVRCGDRSKVSVVYT
jgi:hypothetical protein